MASGWLKPVRANSGVTASLPPYEPGAPTLWVTPDLHKEAEGSGPLQPTPKPRCPVCQTLTGTDL